MAPTTELRLPARLRRGHGRDEEESIASAVATIEHMCRDLGLDDLCERRVLDVGCGVKFSQAFLNRGVPVGQYVGVDVYREMIEFLQANVDDERLEYFHIDVHNERYNPHGQPLTAETMLPVGDRLFDVICLFSVFTHLPPDEFRALLHVVRRHANTNGRLFFTAYIDERTAGGHGLIDQLARTLGDDEVPHVDTYQDLDPKQPLLWAVYSEQYARELIAGTGWEVLRLAPPDPYLQHHFICAPV
jgi:SAM-dependent methyltransferase